MDKVELKTLQALVNKSLIERSTERNPAGRYSMHELLRQYAEAKLDESEAMDTISNTHSKYYLNALAEREPDLKGRDQLGALNDIQSDFENVKAAWHWAVSQKHDQTITQTLPSFELFCEFGDFWYEGMDLIGLALDQFAPSDNENPSLLWAHLQATAKAPEERLPHERSTVEDLRHNTAKSQLEDSLEIAQKHQHRAEIAYVLTRLGQFAERVDRDYAEGVRLNKEALKHYRALEDRFGMVGALSRIGFLLIYTGNDDAAIQYCKESIELSGQIGDQLVLTQTFVRLAVAAFFSGTWELAESSCQEALNILSRTQHKSSISYNYLGLSWIAFMVKGEFARAKEFARKSLEIAMDLNITNYAGTAQAFLGGLACMEDDHMHGRQLLDECRTYITGSAGKSIADIGGAIAACGLEDYPTAEKFLCSALLFAFNVQGIGLMELYLPVAPILLVHQNQQERAVELLGLVFSRPVSETGWMGKWPLLTRLRESLLAELGEDVYNATWERGKLLDLETVVQELLAEFGEMDMD